MGDLTYATVTVQRMLSYLYTDEYTEAPDARLMLAAANEYGIERLHAFASRTGSIACSL